MSGRGKTLDTELYHIKVAECLCWCEEFTVKGIKADQDDFGELDDREPQSATKYRGCGDMHFTPKPCTTKVLDKYGITCEEYNDVADALEECLSFGRCGYCN